MLENFMLKNIYILPEFLFLKVNVRDMKKHTSLELKTAIKNNNFESRKEWIIWMMERA